jgi:hypothetical protein
LPKKKNSSKFCQFFFFFERARVQEKKKKKKKKSRPREKKKKKKNSKNVVRHERRIAQARAGRADDVVALGVDCTARVAVVPPRVGHGLGAGHAKGAQVGGAFFFLASMVKNPPPLLCIWGVYLLCETPWPQNLLRIVFIEVFFFCIIAVVAGVVFVGLCVACLQK